MFLTAGEDAFESETTFSWSSPYVLCVHTTLDPAGLAASVHSIYTGHPELPTLARHLLLGPVGHPARYEDERSSEDTVGGLEAHACLLEHCQQVLELLRAHGLSLRCVIAHSDIKPLTAR
jgi:hypothetical protein